MSKEPQTIYLQRGGKETTWCIDKINDDDIEYAIVQKRPLGEDGEHHPVEGGPFHRLSSKGSQEFMLEGVADLCHRQWAGWMEYLFSKSIRNEDGTVMIPESLVNRWQRQIATDYKDLSPSEQDSDRKEAKKFMRLSVFQWFAMWGDYKSVLEIVGERDRLRDALESIIEQYPHPKLPYGVSVVGIARKALAEIRNGRKGENRS